LSGGEKMIARAIRTFGGLIGGGSFVVGAMLFAAPLANAAFVLTVPTTPVGSNFDTYQGSAATLPADFTVGGSTTNYAGIFTDGVSAYTTANGLYAGTQSSNTADNAFTARVPVGTNLTLTYSVKNSTGSTLPGLTIKYDIEQYQDATATPNTISIASDNGLGGAFDSTKMSGTISQNELAAGGTTTVYTTPLTVTDTATYNQAIPDGAIVQFQFTWTPGGGGNRPIFGVDNLAITGTVPEPTSLTLIGIGGLLLSRRRR
jgi:hypothetical protein